MGEAGPNYTKEDYTDDTNGNFPAGRAFGKYEYAITKKNRFSQSVEFLYDFPGKKSPRIPGTGNSI